MAKIPDPDGFQSATMNTAHQAIHAMMAVEKKEVAKTRSTDQCPPRSGLAFLLLTPLGAQAAHPIARWFVRLSRKREPEFAE